MMRDTFFKCLDIIEFLFHGLNIIDFLLKSHDFGFMLKSFLS
jgi:hypothetical protein